MTWADFVAGIAGVGTTVWIWVVEAASVESVFALAVGGLTVVLLLIRIGIAWRAWRRDD